MVAKSAVGLSLAPRADAARPFDPASLHALQGYAAELRHEIDDDVELERQERVLQLMPSIVPRGWTPCLLPPCIAFKVSDAILY